MLRPFFLHTRLTDILKMPPYAKYMKDIIRNKRKIPEAEIFTMLANYTFKDGVPKKLGDPGIPTIPCSIKKNYVKTALCDLGAGVSVMPFSLYKRLDLNKLTPTKISLQMADKSTAIPMGICEDVPVLVANVTILTDFVRLEMPKDDNMSIILGRLFLKTVGLLLIAIKAWSLFISMVMSIRYTFRGNNLKFIASILLKKFQLSFLEVLNFLSLLSRKSMIFLLLGIFISLLR